MSDCNDIAGEKEWEVLEFRQDNSQKFKANIRREDIFLGKKFNYLKVGSSLRISSQKEDAYYSIVESTEEGVRGVFVHATEKKEPNRESNKV